MKLEQLVQNNLLLVQRLANSGGSLRFTNGKPGKYNLESTEGRENKTLAEISYNPADEDKRVIVHFMPTRSTYVADVDAQVPEHVMDKLKLFAKSGLINKEQAVGTLVLLASIGEQRAEESESMRKKADTYKELATQAVRGSDFLDPGQARASGWGSR